MRTPPPGALPTLSAGSSAGPGESGRRLRLRMNFVANPALDGEGPTLTANALDARHRATEVSAVGEGRPDGHRSVGCEEWWLDVAIRCTTMQIVEIGSGGVLWSNQN